LIEDLRRMSSSPLVPSKRNSERESVMPTLEQISKELLESMKRRDSVRTSTLRMLVSSLRNKEVEKKTLAEGDVLEVIQSEAKRRREAMEEYRKANRPDLAAKEESELKILQVYLPAGLSEAELRSLIQSAIQSAGAQGAKDIGRVMSVMMPQVKGRADGKQVQQLVKELLSKPL
jgi:uncharacterized protein